MKIWRLGPIELTGFHSLIMQIFRRIFSNLMLEYISGVLSERKYKSPKPKSQRTSFLYLNMTKWRKETIDIIRMNLRKSSCSPSKKEYRTGDSQIDEKIYACGRKQVFKKQQQSLIRFLRVNTTSPGDHSRQIIRKGLTNWHCGPCRSFSERGMVPLGAFDPRQ